MVIRAADRIAVLPISEAEGLTTGLGIIAAAAGIITGIAMNWLMQETILR
jgi:hypothetical protein